MSSKEDHNETLRHTNLVDYCRYIGLTIKSDSARNWTTKEHKSLKISKSEPWKYQWYSHQGKPFWEGTAIDFLCIFHGWDFKRAKIALEDFNGYRRGQYAHACQKAADEPTERAEAATNDLSEIRWHSDCKRSIGYLTRGRGLDYKTVIGIVRKGLIREDAEKHNCYFVIKDPQGREVGAEIRGTLTGRTYKQTLGGGGYGFNILYGEKVEKIGFFESAIDLLSFIQIGEYDLNNSLLVSGGGSRIIEVAQRYMQLYPDAACVAFTDADEAGERFATSLGIEHIKPKESCKDWNEMLTNGFQPAGNTEVPFPNQEKKE